MENKLIINNNPEMENKLIVKNLNQSSFNSEYINENSKEMQIEE